MKGHLPPPNWPVSNSSDQFRRLQTGSMDVFSDLVQYRITLGGTKTEVLHRTSPSDFIKGGIYEKCKVDASGDVGAAVGPDGRPVARKFEGCGTTRHFQSLRSFSVCSWQSNPASRHLPDSAIDGAAERS